MTTDIKYKAQIDRSNRNNSHTLALEFALGGALEPLNILEVGCSAGYFGAALKQLGHRVCGVEMDEASSALARDVLDEVHCCTVQAFFQRFEDRQFDVITFGDVLEHLAYPKDVLIEARKHLAEDGRIVCSVPNVGHASVRGMLLQGDWDYAELGILDRTHLRFFTKKTLIGLFEEAGYLVQKLQAVRLPVVSAAQMCGIDLQMGTMQLLDNLPDESKQDFQYVLSASPRSASRGTQETPQPIAHKRTMHILATSDVLNSSIARIRLNIPLQAFADQACRILRLKTFRETRSEDVEWADVVVIQRGANSHAQKVADWCLQHGKPLVYEIDDLLIDLPDFLSHHEGYFKNKALIERLIRRATAVTVTNRRLQTALEHLSTSIWVCPNYHAQVSAATPTSNSDAEKPVHLIVASSDQIQLDFISPPLIEIKKKYGHKVNIVAVGPVGPVLKAQGVDCIQQPLIAYEEFVPTLARLPNAIGLIPLDDSRFSSCKSSIKYLDYAIGCIATVCSDVPPYKDDVTHKVTGMLAANSTEEWVQCITRLIEDRSFRETLARTAREHVVRSHGFQANTDAWTRVFATLVPDDLPQSLSPRKRPIVSGLSMLKELLRQKNHQRKARRRELRDAKASGAK